MEGWPFSFWVSQVTVGPTLFLCGALGAAAGRYSNHQAQRITGSSVTAKGTLLAKLSLAIGACWGIWVVRGPWWYIAFTLFVIGVFVASAIGAYQRRLLTTKDASETMGRDTES